MPRIQPLPALLLLYCLCTPALALGQVFMRPPASAALLGLGGAGLALPEPAGGLDNPARLGLSFRHVLLASAAIPYGLTGMESFQAQALLRVDRRSGIGIGVLHAGLDAIYREQCFQLGYGRQLGERFHLGAEMRYLRVHAVEYGAAGGVAAVLGVLGQPLPNLWIAARMQPSLGMRLGAWRVPDRLQFAVAWKSSDVLILLAELDKDLERPALLKCGLEYRPSPALRLRCGVRGGPPRPAMGAGVRLRQGWVLDAGAEWHPVLGVTPALMLSREK